MAVNRMGGIRRVPPLEKETKHEDQMLSTAGNEPALEKEASRTVNSGAKKTNNRAQKANNRQTNTGKTQGQGNNAQKNNSQNGKAQNKPSQKGTNAKAEGAKSGSSKQPAKQGTRQSNRQPNRQSQGQPAGQSSAGQKRQPANKTARQNAAQAATPANQIKSAEKPRSRTKSGKNADKVRIYFLGGLNEIGKNFTAFEYGDDIMIVDCGLAFPDDDMYGIDIVIPDFTFVEKNKDRIRGIVITHGHEDHIGALPYLLRKIQAPLYGTALTMGLIEGKLREHNLLSSASLNVKSAGSHINLGNFDVEMIHVNHSISDAVALAIRTPAGLIVHTGDFKIDCTPTEGDMIDLARFAQLGTEGVLALLADSTNAERPGYTKTEQMVNDNLDGLFAKAVDKRIIIATFASNISRVQQIINCAEKYGRKVALMGRSMLNVMGIATNLGYLHVPEGILIELNTVNRYEAGEVVLITTGSQGEPMSALTRMAFADHRQIELNSTDFIILSARPIPGNEKTVGEVVDELLRRGCEVIYESRYEVHVSGHACQEELKIIHALTKPKYFIPVHGEQKHLRKHAGLAIDMGMDEDDIFIGSNGAVLELSNNKMEIMENVPAGEVFVDGLGVGDVGNVVLNDRKHLAQDGIIIAVTTVDSATRKIISGPDILSRGFVYVRESEKLMDEARKIVYNTVEECSKGGVKDWPGMKQSIKEVLSGFLYRKTQRSPMILPIIVEV